MMNYTTSTWLRPAQIRAARILIGWSGHDLAHAAGIGTATLNRLENAADTDGASVHTLKAVREAMEHNRVQFIETEDGSIGVLAPEHQYKERKQSMNRKAVVGVALVAVTMLTAAFGAGQLYSENRTVEKIKTVADSMKTIETANKSYLERNALPVMASYNQGMAEANQMHATVVMPPPAPIVEAKNDETCQKLAQQIKAVAPKAAVETDALRKVQLESWSSYLGNTYSSYGCSTNVHAEAAASIDIAQVINQIADGKGPWPTTYDRMRQERDVQEEVIRAKKQEMDVRKFNEALASMKPPSP
jgi:transcriptional regulator with XRE-family HTH domain